jgi:NAD(P)-dependent dehydrogenase (short-subunit alcohol dehydrogenase family)
MRILVAGGSGLIGTAIRHHLVPNAIINYDLQFDIDDTIGCMGRIDAHIPLHNYMYPDFDVYIDCARYADTERQLLDWNTVINAFKRLDHGKMILFSSIYGHKAPNFDIYNATEIKETPIEYAFVKGGVENATRYLAQKLKPWNIEVNCIAPGGVLDKHSYDFQEQYTNAGGVPMIEVKNIMPVIDMLLDKNNAVNGQVITIDRGWSL